MKHGSRKFGVKDGFRFVVRFAEWYLANMHHYLEFIARDGIEYVARFTDWLVDLSRIISQVWEAAGQQARRYNFHIIIGIFYGLMLLLFGRNFTITFTVFETFRHGGSEAFFRHLEKLQRHLQEARNNPAVLTAGNDNLLNRAPPTKAELLTKLSGPLISIFAVLKLQFAKYTSLGLSLGEDVNRVLQRYVVPRIVSRVDPKYRANVPVVVSQVARGVCICFALAGHRYINIVVTSVRGAFTIAWNVQQLCQARQWPWFDPEYSQADFYLISLLVPIGVLFQALAYPSLPDTIRAIFFPTYVRDRLVLEMTSAALKQL